MDQLLTAVRNVIQQWKVITARQGPIAPRLYRILGLRLPFAEACERLNEVVLKLEADGFVNLSFGADDRVTGMYWIEADGTPNYRWLRIMPPKDRAQTLHQWLTANPWRIGMDPRTGLLDRPLNGALVEALRMTTFLRSVTDKSSVLIRELIEYGYVEKLFSAGRVAVYCVVISAETRKAALRQTYEQLCRKRDQQVRLLARTQTDLFRLGYQLSELQN